MHRTQHCKHSKQQNVNSKAVSYFSRSSITAALMSTVVNRVFILLSNLYYALKTTKQNYLLKIVYITKRRNNPKANNSG